MTLREVAITLFGAAVSVGISWGVVSEKIASLESRVLEVEIRQDKKDEQTTMMLTKLTEISVNMEWLKKALIAKEK